ncbi:MAG: acyl-CoA dehydrogenase family protein [Microthrixaceae bacterium]
MDPTEAAIFADAVTAAVERTGGADLDAALGELGWAEALTEDPRVAIGTLFEAMGRRAATSSALSVVVALTAGIGTTTTDMALVLPPIDSADPPATRHADPDDTPHARIGGLLEHTPDTADGFVVVGGSTGGGRWFGRVDAASVTVRGVEGMDPLSGIAELTAATAQIDGIAELPGSWDDAIGAGRLALAHELLGAMRTMLDLARAHALERIQFGQPIAAFQAVRHKLAECLVAIEATAAALDGAWSEPSPFTAMVAKAVAGRSAHTVRKHSQQVLAGIGFTAEHDLHRYLARTMVLDGLLGRAGSLEARIGERLLTQRTVPALLPL